MRALEFITGHVIYNPAYTYKFQLKTTKILETLTTNEATSLVLEVCQRSWCELPGGFLCHNCLQQQLSEFSLSLFPEPNF